jgi:hypothetical protein
MLLNILKKVKRPTPNAQQRQDKRERQRPPTPNAQPPTTSSNNQQRNNEGYDLVSITLLVAADTNSRRHEHGQGKGHRRTTSEFSVLTNRSPTNKCHPPKIIHQQLSNHPSPPRKT